VSKACADLIAHAYAVTYRLPVVVTRCGNFYGGGDLNWNRLVPGTIRSILRGQPPVIRSDGTFRRDYFYVEDGATAYLHLVECLATQRDLMGEAFNFSNDTPTTVWEVVQRISALMESSLSPIVLNEATNEIRDQFLSSVKARTRLNWSPQFDLDTGLQRTIRWYKDFFADA
jgi:CDP-glucose 4,6-dehydratase